MPIDNTNSIVFSFEDKQILFGSKLHISQEDGLDSLCHGNSQNEAKNYRDTFLQNQKQSYMSEIDRVAQHTN